MRLGTHVVVTYEDEEERIALASTYAKRCLKCGGKVVIVSEKAARIRQAFISKRAFRNGLALGTISIFSWNQIFGSGNEPARRFARFYESLMKSVVENKLIKHFCYLGDVSRRSYSESQLQAEIEKTINSKGGRLHPTVLCLYFSASFVNLKAERLLKIYGEHEEMLLNERILKRK